MHRIFFTFIAAVCCAGEASSAEEVFRPAVFSGIRVGRDTVAAAKRRFGPPKDTFKDRSGTYWVYYENIGPVRGRVEIIADSKTEVIWNINLTPNPKLSLAEAIALFGKRYRRVRFDDDLCLNTADGAPLYESPTGMHEYIVYSSIGVIIVPEGGNRIEYLGRPVGAKRSQCVGKAPVWPGGPNWPGVDLPPKKPPARK